MGEKSDAPLILFFLYVLIIACIIALIVIAVDLLAKKEITFQCGQCHSFECLCLQCDNRKTCEPNNICIKEYNETHCVSVCRGCSEHSVRVRSE